MFGYLFLYLLASAYGLPNIQTGRIIGGGEADIGEYPSQVSILLEGTGHYGAGSIISEKWVVTAGHCIYGLNLTGVELLVGTNDLNTGGSRHHPSRFILHEDFQMNAVDIVVNDIGLIEVLEPFILSNLIKPVALPTQDQLIEVGTTVTAIGWGLVDVPTWTVSEILKEVDLGIEDQDTCVTAYTESNLNVYLTEICAISSGLNAGTCLGDSGGPLLSESTIVGITSWSQVNCDLNFPTVFTRVASYRDWITQHSGI